MKHLGPLQINALEFAKKYPGPHSFKKDRQTKGVISRLAKRGLITINEFSQFQIV